MDPRAALIRRAAYLMAGFGIIAAGLEFAIFQDVGVQEIDALVLAVVPVPLHVWVAWSARRRLDRARLERLAFIQVLAATTATSLSLAYPMQHRLGMLAILAALIVYSGMVLETRRHLVASGIAIPLAAVSAGAGSGADVGVEFVAALFVVATIAALTGVGARMHAVELAERESAAREARRAARALNAAAQGMTGATTTNHHRILEAVTRAAGQLIDGPAALYVLEDDGRLHPGARHRLPPDLASRSFTPDDGLFGQVLDGGATRMLSAEEADGLGRMHRMLGMQMVVATPVRVHAKVVGTLLAGHAEDRDWADEEIDAFSLLAEHAGRALELSWEASADRRTLERMAELDRIRDDVVATVSHELRTPVAVIVGLSETLARHQTTPAPQRHDVVDRLWANSLLLGRMVEQLLDAALIQRGELVPVMETVDLRRLVQRTTSRLAPLVAQHPVTIAVADGVCVAADSVLLERVVENLLANVVRHTPNGTSVTISARPCPVGVEVVVADDGPGIDATDIHRVLNRFGRGGHLNERAQGIGLGLSLADEILRAHGSAMHVTSRVGRGARFTFVLAAARDAGPASPEPVTR